MKTNQPMREKGNKKNVVMDKMGKPVKFIKLISEPQKSIKLNKCHD